MRSQLLLVVMFTACVAVLTGCEEEPASTQPVKQAAAVKPPSAAVPSQPSAGEEAPAAVKFVYQVEGRRDPFVPLIATKATIADFENPLEGYDLTQFMIKAVIVGIGETKAMIVAPDGRAYILKKGMRLGKANGVIKEINRERILVEEQYQDLTGKLRKNIQELKVPLREGV